MTNAAMHNSEASLELTEAELNHVSSGTAPKQEAVFPTRQSSSLTAPSNGHTPPSAEPTYHPAKVSVPDLKLS